MRLVTFLQGFFDLFRSRYVRYLESEVIRLRMDNAGLSTSLYSIRGVAPVASPDLQDLTARGRDLRNPEAPGEKNMRAVVKRSTMAKWTQELEAESRKKALHFERQIAEEKAKRDSVDRVQKKTGLTEWETKPTPLLHLTALPKYPQDQGQVVSWRTFRTM